MTTPSTSASQRPSAATAHAATHTITHAITHAAAEPARLRQPAPKLLLGFATVVLLTACGGGGGSTDPSTNPISDASRVGALAVSQPGELLGYVRDRVRQRWAQQTTTGATGDLVSTPAPVPAAVASPAPAPSAAASPGMTGDIRSGTTVQEAGVDEADLMKSAGAYVYSLDTIQMNVVTSSTEVGRNPTMNAHRRLPDGRIEPASTVKLPGDERSWTQVSGLLLASSAQRAMVIGEVVTPYRAPVCAGGASPVADCIPTGAPAPAVGIGVSLPPFWSSVVYNVRLHAVSVSSTGSLAASTRFDVTGRLVGTRQIGDTLYLVTTLSPSLPTDILPVTASTAERDAALARLATTDVLPTISVDGGTPQPLVKDTDCFLQNTNASTSVAITTITAIDLSNAALPRQSRCIVGGTEALYMSPQSLVLATTRYNYSGTGGGGVSTTAWRYPFDITTDLHRFALAATGVDYRGSGTVKGHLGWDSNRKPYRISDFNGDLRVLTFTGEFGWGIVDDASRVAASPATVTILRERSSDRSLQVVSQLPNAQRPAALGRPGEQVYAVRFLGDRAYVVTFRQTDPLYVLDLSNPADPRVAGELLVPGFSDYLYPLSNGLLFGVGRDASTAGLVGGVKVSVFDVRNPAQPTELATRTFGARGSQSGVDFSSRGLNLLEVGGTARVALPLSLTDRNYMAVDQGLQRLEVNTSTGAMTVKPLLKAPSVMAGVGIGADRSLQVGAQIYYLSQGQLFGFDW